MTQENQHAKTVSADALESENQRLRARIKSLEADLSGGRDEPSSARFNLRAPRLSDETEDRIRDIPRHAMDELERLARGVSFAIVENLKSTSEVINNFTHELFESHVEQSRSDEPGLKRSARSASSDRDDDSEQDGSDDVLSIAAKSVHESLEIPHRVVQRFLEGYDEEPQSRRGARRVRTQEGSRASARVGKKAMADDSPATSVSG